MLFDLEMYPRLRPQGLKPLSWLALGGTAEAVPFPCVEKVWFSSQLLQAVLFAVLSPHEYYGLTVFRRRSYLP